MKHLIFISLGILIASGCAGIGKHGRDRAPGIECELMGTWERRPAEAPHYRHIKILGPRHFMWAVYEGDTGMMVAMGGGTYAFDGKVYVETLEFGSENLPGQLIGQDQVFVARMDNDMWYHEGTLSNGVQVREVWKRSE